MKKTITIDSRKFEDRAVMFMAAELDIPLTVYSIEALRERFQTDAKWQWKFRAHELGIPMMTLSEFNQALKQAMGPLVEQRSAEILQFPVRGRAA